MAFIARGSMVRATVVTRRKVSQRESTQTLRNRCINEFRAFGWSVVSVNVQYISNNTIQVNFVVDFRVSRNVQSEQTLALELSSELQAAGLTVPSLFIKKLNVAVAVSRWF